MKEWDGEFALVNTADLVVDQNYQRPQRQGLIDHIARDPDWAAFGVVMARRREGSGVLYVVDGQQRLEGIKRTNNPPKQVPCVILPSVGRVDEAEAFVRTNVDRKPIESYDKHKALIVSKDPAALAVEEAVAQAGFVIATGGGSGSTRTIFAIATLYVIYERLGPEGLTQVLVQCRDAWPGDGGATEVNILRGVMRVIEDQGEKYNRGKLTTALARTTPALIMLKSEELKFRHGTARQQSVRDAIKDLCKV